MRHICQLVDIFFLLFQKLCEDKIKLKQTEDLSNMLNKDENFFFFYGVDRITKTQICKLKKSDYAKDRAFLQIKWKI